MNATPFVSHVLGEVADRNPWHPREGSSRGSKRDTLPRPYCCAIASAIVGLTDDIPSISVSDGIATPSRASPEARSATVAPPCDT